MFRTFRSFACSLVLVVLLGTLPRAGEAASLSAADYLEIREILREAGISARLDESGTSVTFGEGDLSACKVPLCRLLRRLARKAGQVSIRIEDSDPRGVPHSFAGQFRPEDRTITLNPTKGGLNDLLSGRNSVFRHELQHYLFNANRANHLLNGSYHHLSKDWSSTYNSRFGSDEMLAFADQARRAAKAGRVNEMEEFPRIFHDDFLADFTGFLKEWGDGVKSGTVQEVGWPAGMAGEVAPGLKDILRKAIASNPPGLKVLTVPRGFKTDPGRTYQILFFNDKGQAYLLDSDHPYSAIRGQLPRMIDLYRDSVFTWLNAIDGTGQDTRTDHVRLKRAFKSPGDEYRFKADCENLYGKMPASSSAQ